jgi:guanylate kinase
MSAILSLADCELPPLSAEQSKALEILLREDGIVKRLSGKAGTGKSTLIRHLELATNITICAMTAKAALNVGGITVDRLFVYDREKDRCRNEDKLTEKMQQCAKIIVLDEASMLGKKMARYVKRVCQMYGKTLILVGDWAQAKPVKDEWITQSTILDGAVHIFLTECHRQTDAPFLEALNALSAGCQTHPAYAAFEACKVRREPDGDQYVRLYATNALTDRYNNARLADLDDKTPRVTLTSYATKHRGDWFPKEEDRLIDDSNLMHNVSLKLGSRLVCTKNDYNNGFVNGTSGELVDVAFTRLPCYGNVLTIMNSLEPLPEAKRSEYPTAIGDSKVLCYLSQFTTEAARKVIFENVRPFDLALLLREDAHQQLLTVPANLREITDVDDSPIFSIRGFPVQLGWAQTIHKAQGATCERVYVDMSSILQFPLGSRHGLAYVALSRAKTLAGLSIYGWNPNCIECDPEVWRLLAPAPPPPV